MSYEIWKTAGTARAEDGMRRLLHLVMVATACACATEPSKTEPPAPAQKGQPEPSQPNPAGGGGLVMPLIRQVSVFPGTTSVDPSTGIKFGATGVHEENVTLVVASLESRSRFVASDRTVRATKVKAEATKDPYASYVYLISIEPVAALSSDQWHWLQIEHDDAVPVWDAIHDQSGEPTAPRRFESRFFTGSAPQVVRIARNGQTGDAVPSYQVFLSEPVELGSLAGAAVQLKSGALALSGCAAWNDGCVGSALSIVNGGFDYKLAQATKAKPTAIELASSVKGSGRTVSEGAAVAGYSLAGTMLAVTIEGWEPCEGASGGAECWHAPQPPAPAVP